MKLLVTLFGLALGSVLTCLGQVRIELSLDQEQFLPSEEIIAKVRITNFSGRTLRFGQDDDWLSFDVEGQNGIGISRLGKVPVQGEFTLDSSTAGTRRVNITPFFNLGRLGHYTLLATVKIPELDQTLTSPGQGFDIISGAKLWHLDFGVPPAPGQPQTAPEVRRYALIQALHRKHQTLYFRLSNPAETLVYRVYPIGSVVSLSRPEPQLDKASNLHVLYQIGPRTFSYCQIAPDGRLLTRQTYQFTRQQPVLKSNDEGDIRVVGGIRRFAPTDFPQPTTASNSDDAQSSEK